MSELVLKNLTLSYFGHPDAIHGVDHVFTEGVNCVYAESGGGKTSLLKAIAGVSEYHDGSVSLDGEPLFYGKDGDVRMVFDDLGFAERRSAKYNLKYPFALRKIPEEIANAKAEEWAKKVGLPSLVYDVKAFRLSPLNRVKLALARALSRPFKVLLLDNPFSALAPNERRRAFLELQLMLASFSGVIVYATDDWEEAVLWNKPTLILSFGYAMECGFPSDIGAAPACLSTARAVCPYYNVFPVVFEKDVPTVLGAPISLPFPENVVRAYARGEDELYMGFPPFAVSTKGEREIESQPNYVMEFSSLYGKVFLYEVKGERLYSSQPVERIRLDESAVRFFDGATERTIPKAKEIDA